MGIANRGIDLHSADTPDLSGRDCVLPFFHSILPWVGLNLGASNCFGYDPEGCFPIQLFSTFLEEKCEAVPVRLELIWSEPNEPSTALSLLLTGSIYCYID